jgi:hypothetical protein
MDAALAFELQDLEKPSRYVLDSQKWYIPNTKRSVPTQGGREVHKIKVNVDVTC